ncbi:MAG TPA: hypothetical protein VFG24_06475 [Nitrosopumilaceae archaeon]|nr:hypothetical protein [Nitrosopumilaceae archaeon]
MVSFDEDNMQKALVTLAIEQALIQFDNASYEIVINKLLTDFDCHLLDCYQNPQYLKKTLVELYGDSYKVLVELIKENLGEFLTRKGISKFFYGLTEK